jgi:uncharacterized protein YwgA
MEKHKKVIAFFKELGFEFDIARFDDRLIAQKLVCLLELKGIDLGYSCSLYVRGPYSPDLTKDLLAFTPEFENQETGSRLNPKEKEVAGELRIKVATQIGDELQPIDTDQFNALRQYIALVKDAGTKIRLISRPADQMKAEIDIYFDPLILNGLGQRLDGTDDEPVQKAIKDYLYRLEFNGEFIKTKLTDYVQTVAGVQMPVFKQIWTKYGTYGYNLIDETYIADSGYMVLDLDNTIINFIPRELF